MLFCPNKLSEHERNPTGSKILLPIAFHNFVKNYDLKLDAAMPKFLFVFFYKNRH